jgi:hypothetical protein
MIAYLKIGLTDPKYPDNDATTIKPDFVNRMLKEFKLVKESNSYLGLDGVTIIMEGFDTGAADASTGGNSGTQNRGTQNRGTQNNNSNATATLSKDVFEHPLKPGWQYTLKNDIWYTRNGAKDSWGILINPTSVKDMILTYGKKGYYIKLKKLNTGKWDTAEDPIRKYRYANNQWELFINNSWIKDPAPQLLITAYGSKPVASSTSQSSSTPGKATTAEVDKELLALGNSIKSFVEGNNFDAYKGWDDDEESAWNDVLYPKWTGDWKKKVSNIRSKVKASGSINSSDKGRYEKSLKNIEKMFTDGVGSTFVTGNTFYGTFHQGAVTSDTWELLIYLAGSAVKRIDIETDF